jgi:transposase
MEPMRKSRFSHYKQDRLLEHFVAGTTARTTATTTDVHHTSPVLWF